VLTHEPPRLAPKQDEHLTFTFVTDGIESAVAQATAAAGAKAVTVVGGVSVIQQLLRAGLVNELSVDVMPVLLGTGLRLFDAGLEHVELEKIDVREIGDRTSLRFRVRN
jgi:dihydrofolate reductase